MKGKSFSDLILYVLKVTLALKISGEISIFLCQHLRVKVTVCLMVFQRLSSKQLSSDPVGKLHKPVCDFIDLLPGRLRVIDPEAPEHDRAGIRKLVFGYVIKFYFFSHGDKL